MAAHKILIFTFVVLFLIIGAAFPQNSGSIYRRSAILNGNQVKTVFGNWGVIGQPATKGPRGAWIYDTNGYIGDVSPLVGAEVRGYHRLPNGADHDTTFFWVIDTPVARPALGKDRANDNTRQAFEPVSGYFNESGGSPAISSNSDTWPTLWPDKLDDLDLSLIHI